MRRDDPRGPVWTAPFDTGAAAPPAPITFPDPPHDVPARRGYERTVKRAVDLLLALLGMVLLLPIFLTVAIAVRLSGPGPVLLRQRRVGVHGSVFAMLKFRTMIDGAEADGRPFWCCENDERITTVGRVLRSHHLDELPQLWNVFVGQMSLVGPRPERPEIDEALAIEIPQWRRRHEARPGITGWAQVRQGYVASTEGSRVKLTHDLYYLAHCSLRLDLAIMFETFGSVLAAEGWNWHLARRPGHPLGQVTTRA